jgi:Polyketide cyclase / dehydrase and lipid transport
MPTETRHLTVRIDRPAADVYAYASDPANIPTWAPGLGTSIERVGDEWFVGTGDDRVRVAFAQRNPFGVIDHEVTLPSGEVILIPMRVIPDGDACEVVFTLRRQPAMSDEDFERDTGLVQEDLARLRRVLEAAG